MHLLGIGSFVSDGSGSSLFIHYRFIINLWRLAVAKPWNHGRVHWPTTPKRKARNLVERHTQDQYELDRNLLDQKAKTWTNKK